MARGPIKSIIGSNSKAISLFISLYAIYFTTQNLCISSISSKINIKSITFYDIEFSVFIEQFQF